MYSEKTIGAQTIYTPSQTLQKTQAQEYFVDLGLTEIMVWISNYSNSLF